MSENDLGFNLSKAVEYRKEYVLGLPGAIWFLIAFVASMLLLIYKDVFPALVTPFIIWIIFGMIGLFGSIAFRLLRVDVRHAPLVKTVAFVCITVMLVLVLGSLFSVAPYSTMGYPVGVMILFYQMAPVAEEPFFRALLFGFMLKLMPIPSPSEGNPESFNIKPVIVLVLVFIAAVLDSILFALYHSYVYGLSSELITMFLGSMVFCFAYYFSGDLSVTIVSHSVINFAYSIKSSVMPFAGIVSGVDVPVVLLAVIIVIAVILVVRKWGSRQ
jgi:membrane protease YdiL (CAAX protease family)